MFGKTFRIQSTEKRHFKGQPHVNLSEHNYCIFYIHIFSQFSGIYRALYGGTPIGIITDYKITLDLHPRTTDKIERINL